MRMDGGAIAAGAGLFDLPFSLRYLTFLGFLDAALVLRPPNKNCPCRQNGLVVQNTGRLYGFSSAVAERTVKRSSAKYRLGMDSPPFRRY
jgi:hypothetical protein